MQLLAIHLLNLITVIINTYYLIIKLIFILNFTKPKNEQKK